MTLSHVLGALTELTTRLDCQPQLATVGDSRRQLSCVGIVGMNWPKGSGLHSPHIRVPNARCM